MSLYRMSIIAAPIFLFVYGALYLLDGRQGFHGPGLFWTLGHISFVLAFLAFAILVWGLKGQPKGSLWDHFAMMAAVIALAGIAVFLRVGIIDIATGTLASNHAAMAAISKRLNAWPDARLLPIFRLGPVLFQVGLLALLIQRAVRRSIPWWSPVAVLLGFLVIGFNLDLLTAGAVILGIGFYPLFKG